MPQEKEVLNARPDSPVIAVVERVTSWLADKVHDRTNLPWHGLVKKLDPEALKDAEVLAVNEWKANGKTRQAELAARHHFPQPVQEAMAQRDLNFDRANKVRVFYGESPIRRTPGPYLPRELVEGRPAVSLRGEGFGGQSLMAERPGGHGFKRTAGETYRDAEKLGYEYNDPRNAILARDFDDYKIVASGRLWRELEQRRTIFRTEAGARAASPLGQRPFLVENAPFGKEWWVPTEAEARFLKQNLAPNGGGDFAALASYMTAVMRNPNLINPVPHVVKNMAFKMLLADGPVGVSRLAKDAAELFNQSNPTLLKEFNEAMPFSRHGRTAGEELERGMVKHGFTGAAKKAIEAAGTVNAISRKAIFEYADPAMRYSLFKHYREQGQGMSKFEAGNHAWVDLIRYGTRSDRIDFWKRIPLNFFLPWRYGTFVSLVKQGKNHPVRTAATIGAVEYIREAVYRHTGYWWHMPTDYAQKPLAELEQDRKPLRALSMAGTTLLLGPGGDYSLRQLDQALHVLQGDENQVDWKRVKNAFWGISQIMDLPEEFRKGNYAGLIGAVTLGAHRAYNYEPKRFTRHIPEWLPGMSKSAGIKEAEQEWADRRERKADREERRRENPRESIEDVLRESGLIK
jgi:hypothetical protein